MPFAKKITTFALAIILPVSLISGYFCLAMPSITQAADTPTMNMAVCGETSAAEHYMAPNNASAGTIALCCVTKKDNPVSGALNLNEWVPSGINRVSASIDTVEVNSNSRLIFENYSISPPQVELLASVIKIE